MASLKDVADASGVSITTASFVLNGKADGYRIAQSTCQRVLDAARQMDFQPNQLAVAFKTGKSKLIGIVGASLDHPIPLMAVRHSIRAIHKHGYNIAFQDFAWQTEGHSNKWVSIEGRHVEGVLVISPYDSRGRKPLERFTKRGVPIVTLDDWDIPGVDTVTVDREVGSYEATRHLLELGHSRIALTVGPTPASKILKARLDGYRRAHLEAGVPIDESLLLDPVNEGLVTNFEVGLEMGLRAMSHPAKPTALFCSDDRWAIGALRALYEAGKRVPEDLALVGFNGTEEAENAVVPLTTVVQPIAEVADAAVSLLIDRLGKDNSGYAPRHISIPSRLVVRRSSGGCIIT